MNRREIDGVILCKYE